MVEKACLRNFGKYTSEGEELDSEIRWVWRFGMSVQDAI